MSKHVILGAGPVAHATATELLGMGHDVASITRSGNGAMPAAVTRVKADATDRAALVDATRGAATIYNCANPPYTSWDTDWPPIATNLLAAAEQHGAVLATMSNLYGYGLSAKPFKESDRLAAKGPKGAVRARMWDEALAAHRAGRVRVTEARASDFVGPWVTDASFGDRVVPNVLKGKGVMLLGALDVPHAVTAMGDVGRALAILGTDERALGRAWHVPTAPARTQRAIVEGLCKAAGVPNVKIRAAAPFLLKAMGLVNPMMKALREVEYQFAKPYDLDSSDFTNTFGVTATPLDTTLADTVAWYRTRTA